MSHIRSTRAYVTLILLISVTIGCRLSKLGDRKLGDEPYICEPPVTREIETADVCAPVAEETATLPPPLTVNTDQPPEDWYLTLEEAVQTTLANSDIIRDLGGRVVGGTSASIYDVAQQELGVDAALSAFDATVSSGLFFNRDERAFNNRFFGGGASTVASNRADYNFEISKLAATGTQYSVRNITGYDRSSNAPTRRVRKRLRHCNGS